MQLQQIHLPHQNLAIKTLLLGLTFFLSSHPAPVEAGQAINSAFDPSLVAQTTSSSTARQRLVQVFFPRFPQAGNDFTQVAPVRRSTSSSSVARFAIEQLIAGPTTAEQQRGLRPAIRLSGASNCGSNFTLNLTNQTAQLKFCRQVVSGGIGDDARAKSAIEATLKQFASIQRVIILNADGSCFGDQSGENRCLRSTQ